MALLGVGGMGEVWRARDTRLGRDVALKLLPEAFSADRERATRFQREAQLLAALNHPHIASIYSFETVDGIRVLEMEMVPGETIQELLRNGPLPLPRALAFAHDVAQALGVAHAKGILHRDLKPANVKVTPEGNVKLLDFGLAKAFAPGAGGSDDSEFPTLEGGASLKGVILGTVPYMSPEQARGADLDARSDVWAFGCLFFEMLTGKKAFDGPTATDVLVAVLDREPDWKSIPPETPLPVVELLKACLAKRADERLPDLASARKQIDLVRTGQTPLVTMPAMAVRPAMAAMAAPPSPKVRRLSLPLAAGGAVLLAVAAAIAWVSLRGRTGQALPFTKLLAVLPAADFTGRSDGRQLCDGFSVSLRSKLQRVSGVSIMLPAAARLETDAAKVAKDTGANLILAPSARKSGDQIQLSYSLALATSPVQIDAGEVIGLESDWFRLENELYAKICASLALRVAGASVPMGREEIARGPSQSDYLVALGCLERIDDPALLGQAAEILERIPGGGDSALVQAALGRAYLSSFALSKDASLAEKAKAAAERAVRLDPDLPEAQVTVARVLRATGRPAEALPILRRVLEKNSGDVEAVATRAAAFEATRDFAGAEATWKHLVEMRPTSWSSHKDLAGFFFRQSRYADAAREYQRAIDLSPGVYGLHTSLGAVRIRQGFFDEAIGALKKSIEIKPSSLAYSNIGACQYLLGNFPEAADSFGKAITLTPGDYRYHVYLGDALTFTPGQSERARQAYEAAIPLAEGVLRVNPKDGGATGHLALCDARSGRRDEAARLVERAVALEPENASVLQKAAVVSLVLGRRDESLRLLARAVAQGYGTVEISSDPEFTTLRNEPRFQQLLSGASGAGEKK
ncbi:MAG: protein kinase [Acidobacteriota bacterium]|nr:protein kinase [Acidobacteriota bacterium]